MRVGKNQRFEIKIKSHYSNLLIASASLAHATRPALNSATPTRVLDLFQLRAERRAYLLVDVAP